MHDVRLNGCQSSGAVALIAGKNLTPIEGIGELVHVHPSCVKYLQTQTTRSKPTNDLNTISLSRTVSLCEGVQSQVSTSKSVALLGTASNSFSKVQSQGHTTRKVINLKDLTSLQIEGSAGNKTPFLPLKQYDGPFVYEHKNLPDKATQSKKNCI